MSAYSESRDGWEVASRGHIRVAAPTAVVAQKSRRFMSGENKTTDNCLSRVEGDSRRGAILLDRTASALNSGVSLDLLQTCEQFLGQVFLRFRPEKASAGAALFLRSGG